MKIHPLTTDGEGNGAHLHINHSPCSREKGTTQDEGRRKGIVHIKDDKVTRDQKVPPLDRNVLQGAHRTPDGAVRELNSDAGGCGVP